jgi:hypothetical protein
MMYIPEEDEEIICVYLQPTTPTHIERSDPNIAIDTTPDVNCPHTHVEWKSMRYGQCTSCFQCVDRYHNLVPMQKVK